MTLDIDRPGAFVKGGNAWKAADTPVEVACGSVSCYDVWYMETDIVCSYPTSAN